MKNHLSKFILLIAIILSGLSLQAQTAISAAGGNGTGSGGSVSYTVGQIVYTTASGSNGSVAQGVQQPYEISVVTGIEATDIDLSFSVYPNPSTDFLILKISNYNQEKYDYKLYNITGSLLLKDKVLSEETQINVQQMHSGTYFLKIISGYKEVKTFKIIKK